MLYKKAAKWFRALLALGLPLEQLDKAIQLRAKYISGGFGPHISDLDRYLIGKIPENTTWKDALRIIGSRAKLDDLIAKRRWLHNQFSLPTYAKAYENLKQTATGWDGRTDTYRSFVDAMKRKYGIEVMSWQDLRKAVGTSRPLAHGHRGTRSYSQWLDSLKNEIGWYSPNVGVSTGYALSNQGPLSLVSHPWLSNKRLKQMSHAHVADPNETSEFIRRQHAKFLPENTASSKNYEVELNPEQRSRLLAGGRVVDVVPFGSMPGAREGHGFKRQALDNVGFVRFDGSLLGYNRAKQALNRWSDDIDTDIWGPPGFEYRVPWKQWL